MQIEGLVVSSTEPAKLRKLGEYVTTTPEVYGVDFMWAVVDQTWGIQRKEIADLVSSLTDGRLGMEIQQLQRLAHPILIIEGDPQWTTDGVLMAQYGAEFTQKRFTSLKATMQMVYGAHVFTTKDIRSTATTIEHLVEWSRKEGHDSLVRRPKLKSEWGTADASDFRCWMLQSVPGVGPKVAQAVDTALAGSPYAMRVTEKELLAIPGVGPKATAAIMRAVTPTKKKRRIRK
jgi:ERCC4-type nuclease